MLFDGGFNFWNFLADAITIFLFIMWIWILINVISDLFRRHDVSGWIKAVWIVVLIFVPYLGVLAYLIFQGRGMAERRLQDAKHARDDMRRFAGFSVADELAKLEKLKESKTITDEEYARLRARMVD
ncbi:PLDc N-terminal domain-containing protein [Rhodoblastus acidophilus]|uniref:PLDc N-terminal domain-containing protein n=1 Tax=Candidatus Rhodoblastus alkanivorans TaxID=2954117 RepID=A0ABS9ZAB3_9HYPH|nr:PLDc N-terminal domain-containing protein [Candidatus Rhodoblastus alkanivorans]MCI4677072.1 PLDc N-terminal domain-containing protein [Candidatus Rhodoblastus alkanivorans]MCI4684425.1 PLDc N-terminal domain-containing protein [Candidatus Rhodoblastus alkanivorans]MDI4641746.1 PLDc N-terminal domain-containing protein [Rhodoblastus acidophilus]